MTAREKAIEAAAEAERNHAVVTCAEQGVDLPPWGKLPERVREGYREEAERCLDATAPHIESALLDRIEEAVKEKRDVAQRLREAAGKGSLVDWTEATRMDTLDAVLAILTEIRKEQEK